MNVIKFNPNVVVGTCVRCRLYITEDQTMMTVIEGKVHRHCGTQVEFFRSQIVPNSLSAELTVMFLDALSHKPLTSEQIAVWCECDPQFDGDTLAQRELRIYDIIAEHLQFQQKRERDSL